MQKERYADAYQFYKQLMELQGKSRYHNENSMPKKIQNNTTNIAAKKEESHQIYIIFHSKTHKRTR
jgi:hypothetical protein